MWLIKITDYRQKCRSFYGKRDKQIGLIGNIQDKNYQENKMCCGGRTHIRVYGASLAVGREYTTQKFQYNTSNNYGNMPQERANAVPFSPDQDRKSYLFQPVAQFKGTTAIMPEAYHRIPYLERSLQRRPYEPTITIRYSEKSNEPVMQVLFDKADMPSVDNEAIRSLDQSLDIELKECSGVNDNLELLLEKETRNANTRTRIAAAGI